MRAPVTTGFPHRKSSRLPQNSPHQQQYLFRQSTDAHKARVDKLSHQTIKMQRQASINCDRAKANLFLQSDCPPPTHEEPATLAGVPANLISRAMMLDVQDSQARFRQVLKTKPQTAFDMARAKRLHGVSQPNSQELPDESRFYQAYNKRLDDIHIKQHIEDILSDQNS